MRRTFYKYRRILRYGLQFAATNRDLGLGGFSSVLDYWKLALAAEREKAGQTHDPDEPIHIFGMKMYSFSLDVLLFLINEIFLRRDYIFTPDNESPLIVDCGSNIGMAILFFKKLRPNARIIGFEPDKRTFQLLLRNVTENGLSNVMLYNAAVSGTSGEVTFFSDSHTPGSLMMGVVKASVADQAQCLPCVKASDYIDEAVDLLKMDVEGAEMDVMRELAQSGKLEYVKAMVMEYHHHIRSEDSLSEMLRLLEENSFGYDLRAPLPAAPGKFQDILLQIYRKRKGVSSADPMETAVSAGAERS
jgi:FkbM family methyltransferase